MFIHSGKLLFKVKVPQISIREYNYEEPRITVGSIK